MFTLLPSLPQVPRRPVERAASWFAWSRIGTMFLCQPTPDRPLPNAQPFGDGSRWNSCLLESEHLLRACFTSRLAGPTCPRRNGDGLGWQLSFFPPFSQLFPEPGNNCIQVFRQIFGEVPAIGDVPGVRKSLGNSGCELLDLDLVPRC